MKGLYSLAFYGTLVVFDLTSGSVNAASNADDLCKNALLTPQERQLCKEQINTAGTKTELAKIQAKFRDRIKEREEAQKPK